jgi:hypothetical protein
MRRPLNVAAAACGDRDGTLSNAPVNNAPTKLIEVEMASTILRATGSWTANLKTWSARDAFALGGPGFAAEGQHACGYPGHCQSALSQPAQKGSPGNVGRQLLGRLADFVKHD